MKTNLHTWNRRAAGTLLAALLIVAAVPASGAPVRGRLQTLHPQEAARAPQPGSPTAATTISPGETKIFAASDGGSTVCMGLVDNPVTLPLPDFSDTACLLPRYGVILSNNDFSTNTVRVFTSLTGIGTPALIPAHATSIVYKDITVAGGSDGIVDAQIAVMFDVLVDIVGVSLYHNQLSLGLEVQDLTDGSPVATLPLFHEDRDGDQGATDVSGSVEIVPANNAIAGMVVELRRGHTYRVSFQLEADQIGFGVARGEAQWSRLTVTLGEDSGCVPVSQQRKIQGCNGHDDDCDGTIDECDEDIFPPTVTVAGDLRDRCFGSPAEAGEAVLHVLGASDDCGHVTIVPALSGAGCDVLGSAVVSDDCGNATTVAGQSLRIDVLPPAVACSTAVTELSPANHEFTDVGLHFTAGDNCEGDLKVEVKVTSDEQTTLPPGNGNASPFPDAVVMRTADGVVSGVLLRNERGGGGDGRVYNIHVFASDRCGNTGHAACAVSVSPNGHDRAVDNGQYFDATGID